jgi:hypothetical protein
MAIIQSPRRIIVEDFPKEDRAVAERLASSLNIFMDEVYRTLSKNLNITDNLNQDIKIIKVTIADTLGTLKYPVSFQNNLKTKLAGIHVIRSIGKLVDSTPFIDFTENSGVVKINNIKGLATDTEYQLVILTIGN